MSATTQVSACSLRTLRSAHGKAFTSSAPCAGPGRDEDLDSGLSGLVRIGRRGRPSSLRFWFVGSLALLAAFFFLLGVDGAEKRLGADMAPHGPSSATELRLF